MLTFHWQANPLGALHLWSLATKTLLQSYTGHSHGPRLVLRACFGGPGQAFVVSGSDDGTIHVWHKPTGRPLATLSGHTAPVDAVHWHPARADMFVSAADDTTLRLWTA